MQSYVLCYLLTLESTEATSLEYKHVVFRKPMPSFLVDKTTLMGV
jgi:hypothetical protein